MSTTAIHATGTFSISGWDEKDGAEHEGAPRMTTARIVTTWRGDLEGESTSLSVMVYPAADRAEYRGYERFVGRLADRAGTFVLRSDGAWEDGAATTRFTVVAGSGTGQLEGLTGEGGHVSRHGDQEVAYSLDYGIAAG
ncbi:MAG TPA: DUF3224 domain-containing protein [Candidatus Dormibacteraeota bacterium]|jgi:hypothetical protein|nr:DUF3224 domain-containing protein [Candidatus Dormibacteraeota bacterium]